MSSLHEYFKRRVAEDFASDLIPVRDAQAKKASDYQKAMQIVAQNRRLRDNPQGGVVYQDLSTGFEVSTTDTANLSRHIENILDAGRLDYLGKNGSAQITGLVEGKKIRVERFDNELGFPGNKFEGEIDGEEGDMEALRKLWRSYGSNARHIEKKAQVWEEEHFNTFSQ